MLLTLTPCRAAAAEPAPLAQRQILPPAGAMMPAIALCSSRRLMSVVEQRRKNGVCRMNIGAPVH